jgi:hypothetical protein
MPRNTAAIAILSCAFLALACSSGGTGRSGDGAAAASAAGPAENPIRPVEPPDGVWLVDEAGVEYYLEPVPKAYGYRRISETQVHLRYGLVVDVGAEDEEFFYVKIYRTDDSARGPRREPTEEERAASAASYRVELELGNRLRFTPFAEGLPAEGMWRNGFEVADLDGDGHLDIIHGPPRLGGDVPVVFRGDGNGNWKRWQELSFPRGLLDYGDVAVADFDGDGRLDLAFASHFRGVLVFIQEEPGVFTPWSEGTGFTPGQQDGHVFSSRRIEAADWTGDGRPDIIALDEGPRLGGIGRHGGGITVTLFGPVAFLNQGDGTWRRIGGEHPSNAEIFGDHLAVADLDGSGRLDFVTSTNMMSRTDLVHFGQQDGSWRAVDLPGVRPMAYVRSVAAADFDGDGRNDIALGYISFELGTWRSGIDLLLARDGGEWERRPIHAREGREAITAMAAGDLDGDGAIDLVGLDVDGRAFLFLGAGDGTFVAEEAPELQQPFGECRAYQVRLADLNGNGLDDILASYADEPSPIFAPDRCPSNGGIMAWTTERQPEPPAHRGSGRRR